MNWALFAGAAVLLGIERVCYVAIWRVPAGFRALCAHPAVAWVGEPVAALAWLFAAFKLLQISVFVVWCQVHGGGVVPERSEGWPVAAGTLLLVAGQALNLSVFRRLGVVGVFYGNRLGHDVPWSRDFPFSVLSHPQYVGTVLSIWGFFLLTRFPHGDWLALPLLETVYYTAGARFER